MNHLPKGRSAATASGLILGLAAVGLANAAGCGGLEQLPPSDVETRTSALNLSPLNVALPANGGVATASSCYGGSCSTSLFPVAAVNNGDRKGLNWGNGGGWNDNSISTFPDSVQITFAGPKTIQEVDVFTLQDNFQNPSDPTPTMTFGSYGITQFEVLYVTTSNVLVSLGSVAQNNLVWKKFTFAPVVAKAVYVNVLGSADGAYSRIVEIEAYTPSFSLASNDLGYWGSMAIADINGDGCPEVLGTQSDCRGHLLRRAESDIGLGALRASNGNPTMRGYRDARFADFNGDGKLDLVANSYRDNPDGTQSLPAQDDIKIYFGAGDGTFTLASTIDSFWRDTTCATGTTFAPRGETILVADFDNDGDVDIFLPAEDVEGNGGVCPTDPAHQRRNILLENNGSGAFTEITDCAHVGDKGETLFARQVEGAQAIDVDRDGKLDIVEASHIWINKGLMTDPACTGSHVKFEDKGLTVYNLPVKFDEGTKFYDWNNDGNVDYLRLTPGEPLHLYQFNGSTFSELSQNPFDTLPGDVAGLNVEDVDGDGFMDVMVAGGGAAIPRLFLYRQGRYVVSDFWQTPPPSPARSDVLAFADFDRNGSIDPLLRAGPQPMLPLQQDQYQDRGDMQYMKNQNAPATLPIRVLMMGAPDAQNPRGRQNQQGRRVTAVAQDGSSFTQTRFVDGGSGYLSNSEYLLTFPTPRGDSYQINAYYFNATASGIAKAGSTVRTYPDGTFMLDATGDPDVGLNLTPGSTVSASSDVGNTLWSKAGAVDGNRSSFASTNTLYGWSSSSSLNANHTEWIRIKFATTAIFVGEVDLYPRNDPNTVGQGFPIDFTVETSTDSATCTASGTAWTVAYSRTGAGNPGNAVQRIHFPPVNAACVRIKGTNLPQVGGEFRMQFAEIEVFSNRTINGVVTASSEIGGWPATNAVNGSEISATGGNWSSTNRTSANSTESITVDMGGLGKLSHVDLVPRNNPGFAGLCFPVDFTIQISPTGGAGSWTTVVTRKNYPNPSGVIQSFPFFTNIAARYVKVEATKLSSDGSWFRFQLAELEAY